MGGAIEEHTRRPELPLAHLARWGATAVRVAHALLVLPPHALEASPLVDHSSRTGTCDRPVSLAKPPPLHRGARTTPDVPNRLQSRWQPAICPPADRQRCSVYTWRTAG